MRLTAELILASPNFLNPLKERELDLRGNKISAIENLGATQDQFDTIDMSDNEIHKLENFPLLRRLKMLILNNNRLVKIAPKIGENLPALDTLILTNNRFENLSDLELLAEIPTLKMVSLLDNPVVHKQNYRLFLIYLLPKLRVLDFKKVKAQEKRDSKDLYGKRGSFSSSATSDTTTTTNTIPNDK